MTHKQSMLSVIRGEGADQIPFAPRMDLWYIAQRQRGTLPPEYTDMNMAELAEALGVACHSVRADFTLKRSPESLALRGLGLDNHPDYPYRVSLPPDRIHFSSDGENFVTEIKTPFGDVVTHLYQSNEMRRNGISLPFVKRYPIEGTDDFARVAWIFENLEVVATPDSYVDYQRRIGERGIAVATGPLGASPMHLLLHELVAMDRFFYLYADHRGELEQLALRMERSYDDMLNALLDSKAEVVFWGANYDRDLTWPPFFVEQIAPWLRRAAEALHSRGKILLSHTDGENDGLARFYDGCGIDVTESTCPAPMTRLTVPQFREAIGSRITIWGGIPTVHLLTKETDRDEFEAWLRGLLGSRATSRLILGVSDNVPPDADLSRLQLVAGIAAQTPSPPVVPTGP